MISELTTATLALALTTTTTSPYMGMQCFGKGEKTEGKMK